jgi:TRAP-type C4-dicarboxylate transport system substrate-binding protein
MKRTTIAVAVTIVFLFGVTQQLSLAAESAKPVTLKTSVFFASNSWAGHQYQWWADELAKRTNNRVKVNFFWMDSLVKQADMLPGIKSKMTDAGFMSSSYFPSNFPHMMMIDLLGNAGNDYEAIILASLDTQEHEPNLKAELEKEGVVMVAEHLTGFGGLHMGKRYASFSELKGKTIRTVGGVQNAYLKTLGINPVFMPYSDIYEATSRGTIDGFVGAYSLSDSMKHYEVVKCSVIPNWGQVTASGVFISREVFLKLPPDIQKIMLDLRKDFATYYAAAVKRDVSSLVYKWIFEHMINHIGLTPEEKEINAKAMETANEAFIKEQEGKGFKNVRKVWDYYMKSLKKHTDERAKK